ncbi:MAG: patatin-like phospholipase family protein [Acidimicrobiia bacterium]
MTTALVLTGGGAHGAYQAGALTELLPALAEEGRRPTILCGASVGALNATAVAATSHLPVDEQVGAIVAVWDGVRQRDVLEPFVTQVPRLLARYATELTPLPGRRLRGLIGTSRLRRTLERWVDWDQLDADLGDGGPVDSLVVTATEIATGSSIAFVGGRVPEGGGSAGRLRYVPTRLRAPHLAASASIPILFEATRVDEPADQRGWYCDGSTRLSRPIGPAVDAGADDVVVVSATSLAAATRRPDLDVDQEPDLADVVVNVLDSLVQDALVDDVERCREHASIQLVAPETPAALSDIARGVLRDQHRGVRKALTSDIPFIDWALGGESPRQAELLSYLLFDPAFIRPAMALGAADARAALGRR